MCVDGYLEAFGILYQRTICKNLNFFPINFLLVENPYICLIKLKNAFVALDFGL